jgi:hypothetical protein
MRISLAFPHKARVPKALRGDGAVDRHASRPFAQMLIAFDPESSNLIDFPCGKWNHLNLNVRLPMRDSHAKTYSYT